MYYQKRKQRNTIITESERGRAPMFVKTAFRQRSNCTAINDETTAASFSEQSITSLAYRVENAPAAQSSVASPQATKDCKSQCSKAQGYKRSSLLQRAGHRLRKRRLLALKCNIRLRMPNSNAADPLEIEADGFSLIISNAATPKYDMTNKTK